MKYNSYRKGTLIITCYMGFGVINGVAISEFVWSHQVIFICELIKNAPIECNNFFRVLYLRIAQIYLIRSYIISLWDTIWINTYTEYKYYAIKTNIKETSSQQWS